MNRHHNPLEPGQCRAQPFPAEFQLAAIMRLQAHHAVGEWVITLVLEQLQAQELARALRHLAAAFDEEIIVHPDLCA